MKVLVIDNDPDIAQVISFCFQTRWPESTTISTCDGAEGLSLIKTENPEIVLLDVRLFGMNGCDLCREIRSFSDVPVIMLSVLDADIDESLALEAGADDYICKPFSVMILLSHVQAVLRRAQRPAIR
jgi:DNA-binding response OmpR family regulator